jgi:hypothetical protein
MKTLTYSLLLFFLWAPRILTILFAIFISFFAFDVFGQGTGFCKTLLALMMHLIPTFLLVIILIFSWKRPWIGGICFILLGIAYIIWSSQSGRGASFIYIVLFVVGILFLASWFLRKAIKEAQAAYLGEDT